MCPSPSLTVISGLKFELGINRRKKENNIRNYLQTDISHEFSGSERNLNTNKPKYNNQSIKCKTK